MQGSIITRVTLAGEVIPVKDALVTITKEEGGREVLVSALKTDENGKTEPVYIDTPDTSLSLNPENKTKPYTSVDIRVDHPGAYTLILKNAQVFPDNVSLLNISLIPLPEGTNGGEEIIDIPGQNL